jgi:hypothetical protein
MSVEAPATRLALLHAVLFISIFRRVALSMFVLFPSQGQVPSPTPPKHHPAKEEPHAPRRTSGRTQQVAIHLATANSPHSEGADSASYLAIDSFKLQPARNSSQTRLSSYEACRSLNLAEHINGKTAVVTIPSFFFFFFFEQSFRDVFPSLARCRNVALRLTNPVGLVPPPLNVRVRVIERPRGISI